MNAEIADLKKILVVRLTQILVALLTRLLRRCQEKLISQLKAQLSESTATLDKIGPPAYSIT